MNDKEINKVIPAIKKIVKIEVDANKETADINTANNVWPPEKPVSRFDKFKTAH